MIATANAVEDSCADIEVVVAREANDEPGVSTSGEAFVAPHLSDPPGTMVDYLVPSGVAQALTDFVNAGKWAHVVAATCPATKIVRGNYVQGDRRGQVRHGQRRTFWITWHPPNTTCPTEFAVQCRLSPPPAGRSPVRQDADVPPAMIGRMPLPPAGCRPSATRKMSRCRAPHRVRPRHGLPNDNPDNVFRRSRLGAHVIATCGPGSANKVRSYGAHAVIDYHEYHWPQNVRALLDGDGVQAVANAAVGGAASAMTALAGGRTAGHHHIRPADARP